MTEIIVIVVIAVVAGGLTLTYNAAWWEGYDKGYADRAAGKLKEK